MVSNAQRVCTRLTMKPVTIAETENNKKKLEPINPNWRELSWRSCMIGTAAIPITALSAKLISINRNSKVTISQAPFGVPVCWVLVSPRDRTTVSRVSALVDREAWILIGNSVQVPGTQPYVQLRYGWVPRQDREKERPPSPIGPPPKILGKSASGVPRSRPARRTVMPRPAPWKSPKSRHATVSARSSRLLDLIASVDPEHRTELERRADRSA